MAGVPGYHPRKNLIQLGSLGSAVSSPVGPGGAWPLNDICCILGWKKASNESNFTSIFTKKYPQIWQQRGLIWQRHVLKWTSPVHRQKLCLSQSRMQHIHFNVSKNKRRQLPPLASYWLRLWAASEPVPDLWSHFVHAPSQLTVGTNEYASDLLKGSEQSVG